MSKYFLSKQFVFIDFETTGLDPIKSYPTELAVRKYDFSPTYDNASYKDASWLFKLPQGVEVPEFITNLTGLTTEKLAQEGQPLQDIVNRFKLFVGDFSNTVFVAHNANFDLGFLFHHMHIKPQEFICTRTVEILTDPTQKASLQNVYKRRVGDVTQEHRAMSDVHMMVEVFKDQAEQHEPAMMKWFLNKVVVLPERELVYQADNFKVLDFTGGDK